MALNFAEVKSLINRAEGLYTFYDEENEEERKLEAFLLQSILLEGALIKLSLDYLEKRGLSELANKKSNFGHSINNAIDDLFLIKKIDETEYKKLLQYKKQRNRFIHYLFDKEFTKLDEESKKSYEDEKEIILKIIKKLKRNKILT